MNIYSIFSAGGAGTVWHNDKCFCRPFLIIWIPWLFAFSVFNALMEELWIRGLFLKKFEPFFYDISFTSTKKYPSFFQKYFSTSYARANPDLDPQTNLCVTFKLGGEHHIGANQFNWQLAPFFNKAYGRFYTHTHFKIDPDTGEEKVDYTEYDNLDEAYWTGGDMIVKYSYGGWTGFYHQLYQRRGT